MAVGNGRKRQRQASQRELRFAQGVAQGKTLVQAARDAGYSESTALKKSWKFLERPHLRNFLTEALERRALTPEMIAQPIIDGLKATQVVQGPDGKIIPDYPDHETRFMAYDRAVALYGL